MRKEPGFTLMELMVTIAIILIVSSIAVPSFLSWLPRQRLKTAVTDLVANIHLAKLQAIRENQTRAIVFNTARDVYWVCTDDGLNDVWDGPVANAGDDTCVRTISLSRLGSGIQLIRVEPAPAAPAKRHIRFDSRGLPHDDIEIELTNMTGSPVYLVKTAIGGAVLSDKK